MAQKFISQSFTLTSTFYQPWKGMVRLQRGQRPFTEFVCVEGNLQLFDYGVPKADKADF